ncbi:hypothetical protein ROTAS13_04041 [Roseomonas sp. TAS13]|nr:hypothetical protein ROTAS13_04041 [Roseomonas sp. TAS13]
MPGLPFSSVGVSRKIPTLPSRSTPRPSAISRRMAEATTSRGCNSSTKRSPLPFTRKAPEERAASLTREPSMCGGQAMPVGWYWKLFTSRSGAPRR